MIMQSKCGNINAAVLGSATVDPGSPTLKMAFELGRAVAQKKATLLTGACPGLPYEAMRGAKSAGGFTIGISPALDRVEHSEIYKYHLESDSTLFTGFGKKGRNIFLVRSADIAFFLRGGFGTLNEFTIAHDELSAKCVIGVLTNSGGFSDQFLDLAASTGKACRAGLITDPDPDSLVELCFREFNYRASKAL